MLKLKSENLLVKVVKAFKICQTDNFDLGCAGDTVETEVRHDFTYSSVLEAFQDIVGDPTIRQHEIGTIDPNIYRDRPDGGAEVMRDYTAEGRFRCIYDRCENKSGNRPTVAQIARFKQGKINLVRADYELYFQLMVVKLDEGALAKLLGVSNL